MKSRWSHLLRKRLNGQSTLPALLNAFSAASRNLLGGMSVKLTVPCETRPPSVAPRKIMGPSGPTGKPAPTQQAQEMNLMADVFHSNIWSAARASAQRSNVATAQASLPVVARSGLSREEQRTLGRLQPLR